MDDAVDYIKAFTLPALKGNRLAVVSRSGGHAVIAADACAHYGFELPAFPKDFLKKIESRLRAHVIRLQNPLDLGDLFELEFYRQIVEEVLKRDDIDGILLGHGYRRGFEHKPSRTLIGNVAQLVQKYEKPVALVIFADAMEIDHLKKNYPIPIFTAPENAMRAIHLSYVWSHRQRPSHALQSIDGVDQERIEAILKNRSDEDHLLLSESIDLLQSCGIQTVSCALADSEESAVQAWRTRNGPVAMKINRPHHSHKTDSGAVKLDLREETAVRRAFLELETLARGFETEVLIQDMAPPGLEVMLGGKQDEVFGPTVLFGLGGILVEALEDVAWRLAPISTDEAEQMIRSIRGHRILQGLRGDAPRDVSALIDRLVRLSWLLNHFPQIQEIDVNPLLVYQEKMGAEAVDARVILAPRSTGKTS
jgi:acetyltransferase